MFSLLYGLIQGSSSGWTIVPTAFLGAAAVLFAGFCRRQITAAQPLLKPALLANKGFTSGLITGLAFFAALSGVNYVISLFLQTGLRYTPGHTSLALLPMIVGLILAAAVCMGLIGKLGRILVLIGLLMTLAGTGLLLTVVTTAGTQATWWELSGAFLVIGTAWAPASAPSSTSRWATSLPTRPGVPAAHSAPFSRSPPEWVRPR